MHEGTVTGVADKATNTIFMMQLLGDGYWALNSAETANLELVNVKCEERLLSTLSQRPRRDKRERGDATPDA
jgi:hypothetical protein